MTSHILKTKYVVLLTILAEYSVLVLTGSDALLLNHYTASMDRRCNVFINNTLLQRDENEKPSTLVTQYETCINSSVSYSQKNLTLMEKMDCLDKCGQVVLGAVNDDGRFSADFLLRVKASYQKYTNATPTYLETIANKYKNCSVESQKIMESMKKKGTGDEECMLNGLYRQCWDEVFFYQLGNTTKALKATCGDQLGQ